jgi:hypothetical protein
MRFPTMFSLSTLGLTAFLLAAAIAQTPPAVPDDPDFKAYFDAKKIGDALAKFDAPAITDAAIKLLEGEKALKRQRKGLSSTKLLRAAITVAAANRDTKSLDKLDKAIGSDGDEQLRFLLKGARASRKFDPFGGEQAGAEAKAIFKGMVNEITLAKSLKDREGLVKIKNGVPSMSELTAEMRGQLTKMCNESLAGLPAADPEEDLLRQIAAASRSAKN